MEEAFERERGICNFLIFALVLFCTFPSLRFFSLLNTFSKNDGEEVYVSFAQLVYRLHKRKKKGNASCEVALFCKRRHECIICCQG
ncbi:hypothetical protein DUNSADRAFT_15290 [Dunaliella salina]|uniref:Encoded protein n=1 Tax=Dunaliella salina TaxID=3046 RepID=A0ABQ7G5Q3_DUNSA|nr:hypothetical protein DUNSADRAFT_15290 [Dunaliella salina]|eukprot:KAF5829934.1 hypothetical protein DUNSADRAFT_15290 [Dunaliella salina]